MRRLALALAVLGLSQPALASRRAPKIPALPRLPAALVLPPAAVKAPTPPARALPALREAARAIPRAREGTLRALLGGLFDRGRARPGGEPVAAEEAGAARALPLNPRGTARELNRLAAAPPAPGSPVRFAVIGDAEPGRFRLWRWLFNRRGGGAFERMLSRASREPVDFVIQLGDMVSRGTPGHYRRFLQVLERAGPAMPYLTVLGNHDRRNPHGKSDSVLYRGLFGPPNYSFDRGGVRFVVLDSSAMGLEKGHLDWLDRALDAPGPKIVFTHVPPWWLHPWTGFKGMRGVAGFRRGATEFGRILERRGVSRVYMGHIHGLGSQERFGVRYVLTGGGGSPLFPSGIRKRDRFHHYLIVEADESGVRDTVQRLDGGRFPIP